MYFCDVGFGGPMPMGAVEINDGEMQEIRGEKFAVKPFEHGKYILVRENSDGQEETVLFISKAKWEPVDFIAPNMFCAMPGSFFASRQASMRTHDGYISLKGDVYSVSKNGITEKKEVTDEEGKEILKSVFGL